jgi:hypothetical protein
MRLREEALRPGARPQASVALRGLLQAIVMSANSSPGDFIVSRDLLVRRPVFLVDGISSHFPWYSISMKKISLLGRRLTLAMSAPTEKKLFCGTVTRFRVPPYLTPDEDSGFERQAVFRDLRASNT